MWRRRVNDDQDLSFSIISGPNYKMYWRIIQNYFLSAFLSRGQRNRLNVIQWHMFRYSTKKT